MKSLRHPCQLIPFRTGFARLISSAAVFALLVLDSELVSAQIPAALIPESQTVTLSLNVCEDTPVGKIKPGQDITKALQWACDNAHEHKRQLAIPAGTWMLSDTVTTPYRSGFTLLGAGAGIVKEHRTLTGVRTVLKWTGEEGKPMLKYIGSNARIGDFTLDGGGKASIGILVDRPASAKGLGTGKVVFHRLVCENLTHGVQMGATRDTDNCDNVTIEWLEGKNCQSLYHGVNAMGMDIVIQRLCNYGCNYGVLMHGGGHLWVQSSLTCVPSTLLRIPDTDGGFGPNNAGFRLSQTKVDAQAGNGFTLVDCDESAEIRILVDGGIQSNTKFVGTFARLHGSNFLHVTDFSSTFNKIIGRKHNGWGTPTVLLEACRIWQTNTPPEELFEGELRARVVNCTRQKGQWVDWDSQAKPEP